MVISTSFGSAISFAENFLNIDENDVLKILIDYPDLPEFG